MDELGHTGLCFFLLQEMCTEKLDGSGANLEESAATFQFHDRIVRQNLRISPVNLRRLLGACAANGLLSFQFTGNTLEIKMPILLNLLDRDQKKARSERGRSAEKARLDKERDKERDKDKEREEGCAEIRATAPKVPKRKPKLKASAPEGTNLLIGHYSNLWSAKYKAQTPITGKSVGCFKTLVKDHGLEKATRFVDAFLQMNDQWFVTKRHDIATLLININAVAQFAETGRMFTKREINDLDRMTTNQETLRALEAGEI